MKYPSMLTISVMLFNSCITTAIPEELRKGQTRSNREILRMLTLTLGPLKDYTK